MAGWVAAAVTGLVVGLLLVGMTAGSLQACEAVRGTSTCGGWGVPILLVIMAALIAIGGFLLRLFHVPDPVSTSFLAVGMVAVIALLFLLDFLLSSWMLLVIPAHRRGDVPARLLGHHRLRRARQGTRRSLTHADPSQVATGHRVDADPSLS